MGNSLLFKGKMSGEVAVLGYMSISLSPSVINLPINQSFIYAAVSSLLEQERFVFWAFLICSLIIQVDLNHVCAF